VVCKRMETPDNGLASVATWRNAARCRERQKLWSSSLRPAVLPSSPVSTRATVPDCCVVLAPGQRPPSTSP